MQFIFTVTVDVSRESGKFASREQIAEQIQNELEGQALSQIDGVGADGESVYNVDEWVVEGGS